MPKKKDPPLSAAEQRKRFEALAREIGANTSKADLKKAVGRAALSQKGRSVKDKK